jgi:hypothetical protein
MKVTVWLSYLQDGQDGLSSLVYIIGGIQSLLLKIMCAAVKMIVWRKLSCSGTSDQADQLDSSCLVDAAVAFCKLQHLDPTVSVKTQVHATFILPIQFMVLIFLFRIHLLLFTYAGWLVALHDLLATFILPIQFRENLLQDTVIFWRLLKHIIKVCLCQVPL